MIIITKFIPFGIKYKLEINPIAYMTCDMGLISDYYLMTTFYNEGTVSMIQKTRKKKDVHISCITDR